MKRLPLVVGLLIIVAGIGYLLFGGLEQNVVYFVTPSELTAKGTKAYHQQIRLGGVVLKGSIQTEGPLTSFLITDTVTSVPVVTTSTPPEMFQEEAGVIVEGQLASNGTFTADRLMLKHGNEYRPPQKGKMPTELYQKLKIQ